MIIDIFTRIGYHPLHEFKQTAKELLAIMNKHNINRTFLHPFPTMKITENNDLVAEAVAQHSDRFTGFMGVNPATDDALDEIERATRLGLRGVMVDVEFHNVIGSNLSKLEILMVPCMDHGLPVFFNTENIHLLTRHESYYDGLDQLAFKYPDVKFIVNQYWPRIGSLMRQHRNIILYTGGHQNTPGPIPRLNEVGPTRICFGSESPVNHPALFIKDLRLKKIPEVFRKMILGKNAERLFSDLL